MPRIILASNSIQKRNLLEEAGISFEVTDVDIDETPVKVYSFSNQLNDISMRKALSAIDMVNSDEECIIVSSIQKILFNGVVHEKPNNREEARQQIKSMQGSNQIYVFVGNTVLHMCGSKIDSYINDCDTARLRMDCISDEELETYLKTSISFLNAPFVHLEEGKISTVHGITVEFLTDMLSKF